MKLTKTHLEYWAKRKAPKWARQISTVSPHPTIDAVVNANAGFARKDGEAQAHNTLGILRSARKRGVLLGTLAEMSVCPSTVVNPKRRIGFCQKWLARILKERKA